MSDFTNISVALFTGGRSIQPTLHVHLGSPYATATNESRVRSTKKPQPFLTGVFLLGSLTVPYFHERKLTIIGAKSFHGPVRDGKGWFQLAMAIRHNLSTKLIFVAARDGP